MVDLLRHFAVAAFDLAVLVPRIGGLASADVLGEATEFDEADTAFDESACEEALAGVGGHAGAGIVDAVEFTGGFGLVGDVAEVGHGGLHAPGHFVVFDGGFDMAVVAGEAGEVAVHGADEVESLTLGGEGVARLDVGDGFCLIGLHDGSLVLGGEEAVAEETDAAVRGFGAAALEDDVGGEVAGFGAEAVAGPGAGAGVSEKGETGVHEEVALSMLAEFGGHAADDADLVDDTGDVREEVADGDAGLAVAVEGPVGGLDSAVVVELGALNGDGHGFTGVFFEEGFGVEGIDVGDAAAHVAEDDGAGFGGDALGAVDESGLGFLLNEAVQGC